MNAFRWLVAIAACAATIATAAPQSISLWGKTVTLPDPPGLIAASNVNSPYYTNAAAGEESAGNKLLAVYLEWPVAMPADEGKPFAPPEAWGRVTHAKSVAGVEFTAKEFKVVGDQACGSMQKALDPASEKSLGIVGRSDRFRTCAWTTRVQSKSGTRNIVTFMTFVLAKGRLLTATYFRNLRDPKDQEAAKQATATWARAIVAANP